MFQQYTIGLSHGEHYVNFLIPLSYSIVSSRPLQTHSDSKLIQQNCRVLILLPHTVQFLLYNPWATLWPQLLYIIICTYVYVLKPLLECILRTSTIGIYVDHETKVRTSPKVRKHSAPASWGNLKWREGVQKGIPTYIATISPVVEVSWRATMSAFLWGRLLVVPHFHARRKRVQVEWEGCQMSKRAHYYNLLFTVYVWLSLRRVWILRAAVVAGKSKLKR